PEPRMNRLLQRVLSWAVMVAAILLTGCATTEPRLTRQQIDAIEARLRDENPPEQLRPLYRALYMEGERSYVLNAMKLAGAAMRFGYYNDAKRVLDEAITRIQAISVGPQAA